MKQAIENYVNILQAEHDKYHAKMFPNLHTTYNGHYYVFSIDYGQKFAKINYTVDGGKGQKSVHCFVEIATGNIYKAATWKAPAKHVRGNILNEKFPIFGQDFYIRP